jgi:ribosomal protein S18 acetylase RimI-like enzyme
VFEQSAVNFRDLAELYRLTLGEKNSDDLRVAFTNSRFKVFVYDGERLVGAGRAIADGVDCAYLCDVAIHPDHQGRGLGRDLMTQLCRLTDGHRKLVLYAAAGKEGFYRRLGFTPLASAMAIFADR